MLKRLMWKDLKKDVTLMAEKTPLLVVNNLKKYFQIKTPMFQKDKNLLKAVDDVSFYIDKGETFGLVGESGCGKSTLGRTIIRLYEPSGGEIIYDGVNIAEMSEKELQIGRASCRERV